MYSNMYPNHVPIISPLLLGCFPAIVGVTKRYPTPLAALALRFKASRALRSFTSAIGFRQIRHRLGPRVIRRLIWIDVGWFGLIRNDLEWNGLIWVDKDWYGVMWSVMGWYGLIRIVLEWIGVTWGVTGWYRLIRSDMEWNGLIWVDMDWYGLIWSDMDWYGLIRTDMEWYELTWLIWVDTDWCGRIWREMGWYGLIQGSFEIKSQTSDNMDRWKAEMGRVREEKRRKKLKKRKSRKKEDPGAQKGKKVAKHYVFPMTCGSGGSKSRLAKAAGAEPAGHMWDEKLHAIVARSTFPSQNVQNTSSPEHF